MSVAVILSRFFHLICTKQVSLELEGENIKHGLTYTIVTLKFHINIYTTHESNCTEKEVERNVPIK